MKNRIEDLRNHLFETLEALKDKEHPMDLDRARTIATVAKEITDSARVEVDMVRALAHAGVEVKVPAGGFLQLEVAQPPAPSPPALVGVRRQ